MQTRAQIDKQLCKCIVGGAERLKFRHPVTAKRKARLALIARLATCGFCCSLSSDIIPAVCRFTPAVLLSLSRDISPSNFPRCLQNSHQFISFGFYIVQKKHFCSPLPSVSVLCFSAGFQSVPREKPGELLEVFFPPSFSFLRVKQKHEVKKEKKKKKVF